MKQTQTKNKRCLLIFQVIENRINIEMKNKFKNQNNERKTEEKKMLTKFIKNSLEKKKMFFSLKKFITRKTYLTQVEIVSINLL